MPGPNTTTLDLEDRIRRLEGDIEHLSRHDQLTGLLTRAAFISILDKMPVPQERAKRHGALIEVAVRGVPRISGTMGRHVGDYVISALAARLNLLPLPHSTKARIDHSHFAVLLPDVSDPLEALTAAKEIIATLSTPVDWVDRKLSVDLAAGVALAADNDGDATNLIHNTELALKTATTRGGPGYAFFNPALAQSARRRNDVLLALQTAVDNHSLYLNYQPIYDATRGRLVGFEALMRMKSPELGPVSPAEFIPVAEEAGLISRLGAWSLAEACRAASNWPQHLTLSVNISPEQFYAGNLVTDVHNALELWSFPAYRLEIEITESTLLKDSDTVLSQLSTLREMGCAVVLDDFGTGYSSLSYLWKFPFSKLKIDRAFVTALDSSPMAKGILQSIIGLAKNLGLKITAEGIETEAHAQTLITLGADLLQGYYMSRPVEEVDLAHVVLKGACDKLLPKGAAQESAELSRALIGR
ncbi:MAG: GGDEF domain-containing protein [Alphaproteobacteria bacterium]|nr:GGDEF domain-containing protein [Alphaproteobacteria bacterium]